MVCWFHFVHFNPYISDGPLRISGAYGYLGVEVFFVISGFVIPYALHRSSYQIKHYGTFLIKRLLRLNPPYYAAIAFILGVGLLSSFIPGFKGEPFQLSPRQLLLNLTYTADIFKGHWLNYVFWTLAIEIQYYLLIGLIYPAIASRNPAFRLLSCLSLSALAFLLPSASFVFHFLFLFLFGILTFQYEAGLLEKRNYLVLMALCGCGIFFTLGLAEMVAGLLTALIIAFVPLQGKLLQFFGDISYSLYLLHMPIYPKVFNIVMRFINGEVGIFVALLLSLGLTIGAAYLLYRLVELPAQRWSSAVRYRASKPNESGESELGVQTAV